jgi:hypothetical protein
MHLATLTLAVLPLLARADFTMWSGSCATGLGDGDGFSSTSIATDAQGACGGCATGGEAGEDSPFDGGNPCAASCADDPLTFTLNGENYDITTSDGTNVGSCSPTGATDISDCEAVSYSCSEVNVYRCVTTYCS